MALVLFFLVLHAGVGKVSSIVASLCVRSDIQEVRRTNVVDRIRFELDRPPSHTVLRRSMVPRIVFPWSIGGATGY